MISAQRILLLPRRNLRLSVALALVFWPALPACAAQTPQPGGPLPSVPAILAEVRAHQRQLDAIQENYTYRETDQTQILNKKGKVEKTTSQEYQVFYVNSHEVRRLIAKNGHPLSAGQRRKQQRAVLKAVRDAQKTPPGQAPPGETVVSVSGILAVTRFSKPRRILLDGRPTIVFDFSGDPHAKAHGTAEKVARKASGTVWIDEKKLEVRRMSVQLDSTYRAGFGLVSLGKGSNLVFNQKLVNHQLWLPTSADVFITAHAFGIIGARARVHVTDSDYKRFQAKAVQQAGASLVTSSAN